MKFKNKVTNEIKEFNPIMINSNLLSAQNRKRFYWTNIPDVTIPEDKGILLKDIVHEYNDDNVDISEYIVPFDKTLKILDKEVEKGKVGYFRKDSQANRVYYIHDKAVTLCGEAGGGAAKMGQYLFADVKKFQPLDKHSSKNGLKCIGGLTNTKKWLNDGKNLQRNYSQGERVYSTEGKCPTLSANSGGTAGKGNALIGVYQKGRGFNKSGIRNDGTKSPTLSLNSWEHNNHLLFGCITPDRVDKRQNGQRFNKGKKFYTLTAQDKHGVLIDGYIRKLTPIECERLQTLDDNYTECEGVSDSQRYKCLGNGWTVDVIVHILKNIL